MSDAKADTIPAPAELKEQTLAHMSNRLLAMGEELRELGMGLGTFGGTVDRHESEIADLKRRLRELERRVETGEHPTIPEQ